MSTADDLQPQVTPDQSPEDSPHAQRRLVKDRQHEVARGAWTIPRVCIRFFDSHAEVSVAVSSPPDFSCERIVLLLKGK
jgi:hypothetical protein